MEADPPVPPDDDLGREIRTVLAASAPAPTGRWETIARAGRRRRRQRLAAIGGAAVLAIGLVAAGVALVRGGGGTTPHVEIATMPPGADTVGGNVAWFDGGRIHTSKGASIVGEGPVKWSHDGRWIAFLRNPALYAGGSIDGGDLWVARGDGSHAHKVAARVAGWQWSPSRNELAVSIAPTDRSRRTAKVSVHTVPHGATRRLPDASVIFTSALRWSPDGTKLAYVTLKSRSDPPVEQVTVVDLEPSRASAALRTDVISYAPAGWTGGYCVILGGWTSDSKGVLVWTDDPCSGSIAMDGLPLTFALAFGRPNTPVELGRTQVKSPWLVGAPGGRTILVAGGARDITEHRTIESCIAPTGTCTTIVDRPGAALDPAVSVDGTRLAFVHDTTPPLSTDVSHRYAGRTLWVSDLDGSHAGEVTAAGTGIASPRWTSDGRILYERDRALWIVDPDSGEAPARLAASIGTGVPGSLGLPDVSPYINGDIQRPQWEDIFDFVSLPHAEK